MSLAVSASLPLTLAHAEQPTAPLIRIGGPNIGRDMFPDSRSTFDNGVGLRPNVTYWTPSGFRPLQMDIYSPPAGLPRPEKGFPMLMFIHGGGWIGGNSHYSNPIADFPQLLAAISARGYVVTSVNYRLSGEAKWPAQGQDIKAAIRYLRASATDLGIDPGRFATWGVSAGGQLSAMAATSCGLGELQPQSQSLPNLPPAPQIAKDARHPNSDCVQAAIAWYGVFDMMTLPEQARLVGAMPRDVPTAPEWRLLGCMAEGCSGDKLASASPMQTLTEDAAPMLLITGDADKVVPATQSLEFAGALEAAKIPHQLTVLEGVGHNFTGADPSVTQAATQQALDEMLAFLDLHLLAKP